MQIRLTNVAIQDLTPFRLWRARRRQDHVDAVVEQTARGWRLEFRLNDRTLLEWWFDSREAAIEDAHARLAALQRVGWNAHW